MSLVRDPVRLAPLLAAQLVACGDDSSVPGELVHEQVLTVQIAQPRQREAVDILFVIDDSSSMAAEQARLAANFRAFVDVLEDPSVEADYRIGVTTTDAGNPGCSADTTDRGALLLEPCTQRLDEFVAGDVDVRAACTDNCTLSLAELEIVPTATAHESAAARPWLENIDGETNLPAGVDVAEALACFAPQGIGGCEFESPLESMHQALDRSGDAGDPAYGFLRADATTVIVFVTDGHDCSVADEWAEIFAPEGERTFWSDPTAAAPTQAVCWNAGVECEGDPSHYASCVAVDKDSEGALTDDDDRAVLHPLRRYVDRLQAHEELLRQWDVDAEVIVALVAGVEPDGDVSFADAVDPEFQDAYGIAPGCTAAGGVEALPPVRLREFTAAFTPDNAFSICSPDFTPALEAVASHVGPWWRPACFPACVKDQDPSTAIVEPDCIVEQRVPGRDNEYIDECVRDAEGAYVIEPSTWDYQLPAGANVCYAMLTDADELTVDPNDDMSPECTDLHYRLEFKIARRPGHPAPNLASVFATCSIDQRPSIACPDLGSQD